jgi:hypothetical protein
MARLNSIPKRSSTCPKILSDYLALPPTREVKDVAASRLILYMSL